MRETAPRWLARDGRLRTPWRVLLFIALTLTIAQLELLLLPVLATAPVHDDRISAGLLAQAAILLSAALAAGWVMLRKVEHRPFSDFGFALDRPVGRDLLAGLGLGALGIALVVAPLTVGGAWRYVAEPGTVAGWLGVTGAALLWLALPAVAEEALFRGYAFRTLVEGAGPVLATLLMSALFAAVHGSNPNVHGFGLANIFLAGAMLSAAVLWTGSLWFASALHLGWNWAMAAPLDLPVSGLDAFDAPFYDVAGAGPAWLTGGPFGPEGGLAGTVAVGVVTGLVWWYSRRGGAAAAGATGGGGIGRESRRDGRDR